MTLSQYTHVPLEEIEARQQLVKNLMEENKNLMEENKNLREELEEALKFIDKMSDTVQY